VETTFFRPMISPPRVVEESRHVGRLDGYPDADAVAGGAAGRNGEARAQRFVVPNELRRLARGKERTDRLARQLQNHLARFRAANSMARMPFSNSMESSSAVAYTMCSAPEKFVHSRHQSVRTDGNAQREPQRFPRGTETPGMMRVRFDSGCSTRRSS